MTLLDVTADVWSSLAILTYTHSIFLFISLKLFSVSSAEVIGSFFVVSEVESYSFGGVVSCKMCLVTSSISESYLAEISLMYLLETCLWIYFYTLLPSLSVPFAFMLIESLFFCFSLVKWYNMWWCPNSPADWTLADHSLVINHK